MKEKIFLDENQKVVDSMWGLEKVLNSNIEFYDTYKFYEKKEINTFDDYLDLRANLREFLDYYSNSSVHLIKINEVYGIYYNYFAGKSYEYLDKLNKNQNLKNFYILLSVLAQILSLFFLLVLFKTLLNFKRG
jgi:hypothetical protein